MHQQKTSKQLKILIGILMAEDRIEEEESNSPSSLVFVPAIPEAGDCVFSWAINNLRREDGEAGNPVGFFLEVGETPWEVRISVRGDSPKGFHVEDMEGIDEAVDFIFGCM